MDVNLTRLSSSVTTNCYNLERQSFIFHSSLFLLSSKMSTKPKTFLIELMLKVGNISRCSKSILRTEIEWDQFLECSDTEGCERIVREEPSQETLDDWWPWLVRVTGIIIINTNLLHYPGPVSPVVLTCCCSSDSDPEMRSAAGLLLIFSWLQGLLISWSPFIVYSWTGIFSS